MSIPIVRAKGLTKLFGSHKAVDDISFDIWPAEIVGFLGPNGAGKTTTIRMLLNILRPNTGHLEIFGETYAAARKKILQQMNASSGTLTLPGKLSVHDNLHIFADLYGIDHAGKRVDELIEKFDLTKYRHRQLYSLSTGQQVRVSLAKAFINRPRLLLLDEPTSSLDPEVADRVRNFLIDVVREEKTTVFLTSHNMQEVEKVCSRVLFINLGRIQAEGTPRELALRVRAWRLTVTTVTPTGSERTVIVEMDRDDVGGYFNKLVKSGHAIKSMSIHEPTLEDFFVQSARGGGIDP
jgi:ABC-2 type transport system ATP-binding protein